MYADKERRTHQIGYSVNDLFMNNGKPTEPFECAVTQYTICGYAYSLCKHTILTSGRLIQIVKHNMYNVVVG